MTLRLPVLSRRLTISRLKTARACLREHDLRYVQGWRPVVTAAELHFGTLIHSGLEAMWRAWMAGRLAEALDEALAAVDVEADPFERAKARAMLRGYHARWEGQNYEVLAVEVEFEFPLVNPASGLPSRTWVHAGKIDAIVRDEAGRVLVVEHKTSSEKIGPGSDYWRRLTMDGQVSLYFDGAASLGYDVQGCLYDVLGKPGEIPLKATPPESRKYKIKTGELYANQRERDETPDEYQARVEQAIIDDTVEKNECPYQRGVVVRLADELDEARADNWQTGRLLRDVELSGRAPRNPDACLRYGRTCSFFDVCSNQTSLDSGRFERSDNPHPELSGAERTKEESGNEHADTAAA